MSEFTRWFYSAENRKKYDNTHPVFLAAGEAWLHQLQELTRLKAENERMKEALKYYASYANYDTAAESTNLTCVDLDGGSLAREAINNES